ncbi:hypothetical protein IQ274_10380 [Nostoc sp. LEGE 12447]|uniref:Effector-associated domain-containing protein n=2 Tax=Nostoc TaxID=1177 RepID=A0ABR8I8Z4_9NOSO|nr:MULTISPECIES: hypothetical protein [Nostoc]MBD2562631.1 hypothetical protein [Nostoc linckia FACHB-391]MBD2647669.1 hypothetical protein [Nostoc foliaceum FACHB-393]MBE8998608.1 hypothetical protein [Nostoc sp. LEGE 12447]
MREVLGLRQEDIDSIEQEFIAQKQVEQQQYVESQGIGLYRLLVETQSVEFSDQIGIIDGNNQVKNTTTMTNGLPERKRRRLEQERDSLQQQYELASEKLSRLRQALTVEVDPSTKLKLEKQREQAQTDLNQIDEQLEQIELLLG